MAVAERAPSERRVSTRLVQILLALAGVSAFIVVTGVFGTEVAVVCLVLIVAATVLTAPAARGHGGGWWVALAVGAALSVVAPLVAEGSDTLGGYMALVGGVTVVIAAAIGFPVEREEGGTPLR